MWKLKTFIFSLIMLPCTSFATVGGPQNVEFLGYDAKDQKVYLLKHYEDGRGRLPQLYYYQFKNNKQPEKLIQVNSLYIHPKTKKIDYDQESTQFNKDILKIKKRLTPLIAVNKASANVQILKKTRVQKSVNSGLDGFITEYQYRYKVVTPQLSSLQHIAKAYKPNLNISQAFKIPQHNKIVVAVKYLGIPFETGYTIEDPVLLTLKK
ncbi:aminotransferase [Acinetobacter sp. SFB]|uniref:aminotransferase n=1 Tax=Acinetobacter sp. SFB TaxID=1805634 RepID=UPI0007D861D4|nr:aminotransferase [Acinetobacter sp. SFB]OAL79774.1 aminotransferase [Acinetobacter sp. SFB]